MEGTLTVTPQELIAKSSEFDSTRSAIMSLISEMNASASAVVSAWQGEASNAYQTSFKALSGDIARLDKLIKEHVSNLGEMAQNYLATEAAIQEQSGALPKDVIQ